MWSSAHCVTTIPNAELPYAGSIPIDVEVNGIMTSGLYFLPFSIAASMSFVWNTLPILPRYLRLYSCSNEVDCLASSVILVAAAVVFVIADMTMLLLLLMSFQALDSSLHMLWLITRTI